MRNEAETRLKLLLSEGESRTVEFKTAERQLPRDLYETVCAFLNRNGGDIFLGVSNDGQALGIDAVHVQQMKKDFVTAINNPQKINPPCYLVLDEIEYEGVTLLHVQIPTSAQVHRCRNRIYDRNEDGDFDITDNQSLVAQLYKRKEGGSSETTVYPDLGIADLRPDLIERARKMAGSQRREHPWLAMDDIELLTSARLIQNDGAGSGLTQAAILLFGKDLTIQTVLPHHKTDAILRRVDVDRYDDRDDIRTNLLESYDRLIAFGEKHLNDPFFLEGTQRISLRSHILREIAANLLIHRDYSSQFPAKFVIEAGRLFTENANIPHGFGPIDPAHFSPFAKNPVIADMFKEIGRADELGSGVRKLFKYSKAYGGHDPELLEGDVFRLILSFSEDSAAVDHAQEDGSEKSSEKSSEKIVELMRRNAGVSARQIADTLGISPRAVEKQIAKLKLENRIRRIGPDKGGHWEVIE